MTESPFGNNGQKNGDFVQTENYSSDGRFKTVDHSPGEEARTMDHSTDGRFKTVEHSPDEAEDHFNGVAGREYQPVASSSNHRFKTGDRILDRYVVQEELGQGGMGVVYKCFDEIGRTEVAVKSLPPEVSHNPAEMEDVRDNYTLVTKLAHPNIASCKTLERDADTGDYYLVMDYVDGDSLRSWMRKKRREGTLTLEVALPVLRQIAEALDAAHRQGVIHRDIKPDNVKIQADGTVKVLDFGLAAQVLSSMAHLSNERAARAGTNLYKSPEQWLASTRQGKAADQYSLAVTAYEMLSGRVPFENNDMVVLKNAVLTQAPEPIEGLPSYANTALMTGLAKEPKDRYANCVDFVRALGGEKVKNHKGNRMLPVAAVAAIILAVGGVVYFLHDGHVENNVTAEEAAPLDTENSVITECQSLKEELEKKVGVLRQLDRGQTFGVHLDSFERCLREAEEMWRQEPEKAIDVYKKAQAEAKWLEDNSKSRLAALNARNEADRMKVRADEVEVATHAQDVYKAAERNLNEGERCFEMAKFDDAEGFFSSASVGFNNAVKTSNRRQLENLEKKAHELSAMGGYDNWAEVSRLAEQMARWDARVAAEWREKAEFVLKKPRVELKAFVNGREVNAKLLGTDERTPLKKEMMIGNSFTGKLFYHENGESYELAFNETVNWTGLKSIDVELMLIVLPTSVTLPDESVLELVRIKAGRFQMGSPESEEGRQKIETQHPVTLTRNYCLGKYEVTQGQWKAVMGTSLLEHANKVYPGEGKTHIGNQGDNYPMYYVNWDEAMAFCRRLTELEKGRLPAEHIYTLPTEAQWEYACRAGTTTSLYNGDIHIIGDNNAPALDKIAWYSGNSSVGYIGVGWDTKDWEGKQYPGGRAGPRLVGKKSPNAWGLYDMLGNVSEWCSNQPSFYPTYEEKDPKGSFVAQRRMKRGGDWYHEAKCCRPAFRCSNDPEQRANTLGFRVALVPIQ